MVSLNLVGNDQGESLLFRDIGDVTVSFADRGEAFAQEHPGSNDYQGSDIQQWCAEFPAHFLRNGEQQALMPTAKSDSEISIRPLVCLPPMQQMPLLIFLRLRAF